MDGPAERPCEAVVRLGALETGEGAARIRTATGEAPACRELAVGEGEPDELVLRRAPAAAGAPPDRVRRHSSDGSSGSTGIPAGTSSGGATFA